MLKIMKFETRLSGAGRPVDWVLLRAADAISETGNVTTATWHRVEKLRPPEGLDPQSAKGVHMRAVWSAVEPAWMNWRENNEIPETGTPLSAWAGVTGEQADVLRRHGIRTVEDVAAIPEANVAKLPLPNVRAMRDQAKAFLAAKPGDDAAREIENLKAQLAEAVSMLAEKNEQQPKRRGRPPKAKPADEEAA